MTLFQKGNFIAHAGQELDWKLECDTLTDEDWKCIAYLISKRFKFGYVKGIPSGGLKLAEALKKYISNDSVAYLVVDDVLTTGGSMEEEHNKMCLNGEIQTELDIFGVVLFARGKCPDWITPIFQMSGGWQ